MRESEAGEHQLKRTLGPVHLIALGIGAIIGAGLFALTPKAAHDNAGPAVVFSFLIAAFGCAFAGMCYSEFATMIPIAGSAYTYAYATMGELLAWIIGWDLVLEYATGAATVSVSWSKYLVRLFQTFGITLPPALTKSYFEGGLVNLPAILIICVVSVVLIVGIQESARLNGLIVALKVAIVVLVIGLGFSYINHANYVPFIPPNTGEFGHYGWSGVMRAAGVIFFAYIGFDAVSTAAQEAKNPQRDMPLGIIGSLGICTLLYVGFAYVLSGIVNYKDMTDTAIYEALHNIGYDWLGTGVVIGILAGYTSVILVMLLGQSRVFYSMSRDGLLPKLFSDVHPKFKTPWRCNLVFMAFVSLFSGFVPLSSLGDMTSIGTLLAFVIVCGGILVMRHTHPHLPRPYRTPFVPVVPILGIVVCFAMMASLDMMTWIRLVVWLIIGLAIYFTYSRSRSHLVTDPESEHAKL
ncbi:MAG: basic amino acid/polyamine antiporter, family [Hyphomicrobiales bacterium]|nr:basic amino acid/polyamine antiporter, family [Bryobacterales bacterium]MEA2874478.1 basic amino acid/polyamine antiporter, family [Hyphomicrobiales bacterium]